MLQRRDLEVRADHVSPRLLLSSRVFFKLITAHSRDDCANGVCWEGQCPGHTIYSTDGNCGYQHGYTLCAGKLGDCCSLVDGKCGTGDKFCGATTCQSGNCTENVPSGGMTV